MNESCVAGYISNAILFGAFASLVAFAMVVDIRSFRIPNSICYVLIALFMARVFIIGLTGSVGAHLLIAGITFVILFLFYVAGVFGAGDSKLISVIALWAGPSNWVFFLINVVIAGGLFAAFLLLLGKLIRKWRAVASFIPSRRVCMWSLRGVCPYGVPIFCATLLLLPRLVETPAECITHRAAATPAVPH